MGWVDLGAWWPRRKKARTDAFRRRFLLDDLTARRGSRHDTENLGHPPTSLTGGASWPFYGSTIQSVF